MTSVNNSLSPQVGLNSSTAALAPKIGVEETSKTPGVESSIKPSYQAFGVRTNERDDGDNLFSSIKRPGGGSKGKEVDKEA